MIKKKLFLGIAAAAVMLVGFTATELSFAKGKKTGTFKVRIENIGTGDGLAAADGSRYPFALSPGLYVVNHRKQWFFKEGEMASGGLEQQAEDGNPETLSKSLLTKVGSVYMGIFNTPTGAEKAGPLLPGNSYEFSFAGEEGMKLNFIAMYGQSNDLFYAPKAALDLFDKDGNALSGDITDSLLLWDAGTEVNQAPGIGDEQAPRQKMANTGKAEKGIVGPVKDGFTYPNTKDVLRVTVTVQ